MRLRLALCLLVPPLAACPGDMPGPSGSDPASLAVVRQPAAAAGSGVALDQQPIVRLLDAQGRPVARSGVLINASLVAAGASLTGTAGVRTDAEGQATWTDLAITGAVGSHTLRFEAAGLAGVVSSPVQLGPGAAVVIAIVGGVNQVAAAGTALAILPKVRATDGAGNPVAGASVTFEVTQGGGTVTGEVRLTEADGTASPEAWTLGPLVGLNTLEAYLTDAPGTVLTFSATAIVGPPALLEVADGDGQSATIGTAVATAPGVKVTDAFGNAVPGVSVTFTAAAGSGTVTGASPVSNAAGIARVTAWTLGFTPGENTLTASRTGVTPVTISATGVSFPVSQLAAGAATSCAVTEDGLAYCWGSNAQGQLGNGTVTPENAPALVSGEHLFAAVGIGSTHSCGLDTDGKAWCWGRNQTGQLGDGTQVDRLVPTAVQGNHPFTQIAVGSQHTCGLRNDGVVLCWGSNANGRLGDGTTTTRLVPTPITGNSWTAISTTTGGHTCGLQANQTLWCWGFNGSGRLGDGTTTDRSAPTLVLGGFTWQAVGVGGAHTCALTVAGQAYCWGTGGLGQLGTGSASDQSIPVPVTGGHLFAGVTAGTGHSCAYTAEGVAWCWGQGGSGQLGLGTNVNQLTPVEVTGGFSWAGLIAGGEHTCARTTDGSAVCWGRNQEGQVGDGTNTGRPSPVGVKPPAP